MRNKYYFVAHAESPDGEIYEFKEFHDVEELEEWINEFLDDDYCSWNDDNYISNKDIHVILGRELTIKPKEIVRMWGIE